MKNESHQFLLCVCVFKGKGLWTGFGMRRPRCSIPPCGTVIVACVYVCQRECAGDSRLSVLADAHHMELFTPSTLRPAGHAHTRAPVFVSLTRCVLMFLCSSHTSTFSPLCPSSPRSSLSLFVSVCSSVPSVFCVPFQ